MKKTIIFVVALFLMVFLVSCGEVTRPATPVPSDATEPTGNGGGGTRRVNISYADWGNHEVNQKMINKFMEKYPHIKVDLRSDIAGSGGEFTGNLINAAQADMLPDVFAIDNVPTVVDPGLAMDVSAFWDADSDAALVYENIANTAIYNGKRYAIPSFQFLKGILINLTIFEKANLMTNEKYRIDENGYPEKDWTFDEWIEITKAITNYDTNDKANFVAGLGLWFGAADFQQVWPMMHDANVGYDTWDGEKFNFTSQAWIDAMKVKVDIMNATKYPGVTMFPEEDAEFIGELGWMIAEGYHAMSIDGSWNFGAIQTAETNGQQLGFWPYPQGDAGFFPPTILDYQIVSSQTKYPEEAYLLAKWMTYGEDGWNARLEIMEELRQEQIAAGEQITFDGRFPVADYPEVWERVRALFVDENEEEYIPGLFYSLDNIANSKPDLDKWLAGYKDFWIWVQDDAENPYRWSELLRQGPNAVATFAQEWNAKINQLVQDAIENLGK